MKTEQLVEAQLEKSAPLETEKKREMLSIQVTPEEKKRIAFMAIGERGISVSEFVRRKIFTEQKTVVIDNSNETPLMDEERQMYEDMLDLKNKENQKLKDDLINFKVAQPSPAILEVESPVINPISETALLIELDAKTKAYFDAIKQFREDKIKTLDEDEKAEFMDYDKFVKTILLRGFKRSFYGSVLNSSTGLTTDDIREMAKAENIDYEEQI